MPLLGLTRLRRLRLLDFSEQCPKRENCGEYCETLPLFQLTGCQIELKQMSLDIKGLVFAADFDPKRLSRLQATSAFAEVVILLLRDAKLVGFDVCPGKRGHLKNCVRPEFQLDVHRHTFDIFFNGTAGYRAQYLNDADQGQKQNNLLLSQFSESLLAYAASKVTKHRLSEDRLAQSLRGCS